VFLLRDLHLRVGNRIPFSIDNTHAQVAFANLLDTLLRGFAPRIIGRYAAEKSMVCWNMESGALPKFSTRTPATSIVPLS
jgi:hypothetical protein